MSDSTTNKNHDEAYQELMDNPEFEKVLFDVYDYLLAELKKQKAKESVTIE